MSRLGMPPRRNPDVLALEKAEELGSCIAAVCGDSGGLETVLARFLEQSLTLLERALILLSFGLKGFDEINPQPPGFQDDR
jgi:type II secretory pathway predicted ATPase ExeA